MDTSLDYTARCLCGRVATRVHCPKCGCADVYAYSMSRRYTVLRTKEDERKLRNYRCKACGEIFNQDDWTRGCNAPPYRTRGRPPANEPRLDTPEQRQKFIDDFVNLEKLKELL